MNPTPMEVEPPPHMQQTFQRPPIPGSHYAPGQMPMQPAGLNGPPFPSRPAGQPMPPPMTQPHPSSHPSQAQPNQPQRRIQTPADLKTLLMNQLKEGFPKYFDLLKQFVNGKVTKPEFESELRKILPEKLVAIHNMFMMTILRSAYIATLRHRKTKTGPRSPYGKRGLPDPLGRREHRTTTEYSTLKSKMEKIARGAGLTNMQPECVPLMLTALDHVLTAFMYKSDVNRTKRTLPGPKYMFENDVTNDGGNIVDLNHVAQYGNNGYVTPVIGPSSPSPLQMGVPTEYITNPASMRGMELVEVHNTVTRDDLVQALRQRPQLQLIGSNMVTVAELLHSYEE